MTIGGRKVVKLPLGYVNNGSSTDEVELRAMVGDEEDIFSDTKIPFNQRINTMILNCIVRVGTETDKEKIKAMYQKFSIEDQNTLLVFLRAISVKDVYEYITQCPSCNAPIQFALDLNSLSVTPGECKAGLIAGVTLPSGRTAKIKPMLIEDSGKLDEYRDKGENSLSLAIWTRLVELDQKPSPTLQDVKGMLFADRVTLRNAFDKMEGGVESEFPVKCKACGNTFQEYLDVARPEFFSPKM